MRKPAWSKLVHGIRDAIGAISTRRFRGSEMYWERRYALGGNSGAGSYAELAQFKAEVLNGFVTTNFVTTVIEFGCGDGNQLSLADYPHYLGFDVSRTAISLCRSRFQSDTSKAFREMIEYQGETADLTLSLDVIYHLVEDDVFERHMTTLFEASRRYVVVYASNFADLNDAIAAHVKHRKFTDWVAQNQPAWKLTGHLPNRYPYRKHDEGSSFSEFFFYEKRAKDHLPSS